MNRLHVTINQEFCQRNQLIRVSPERHFLAIEILGHIGDDINQAEAVIKETLTKFDAILDEPKPIVRVHELGDSSVNLIVRPWVHTTDYWETYWGLTKEIKLDPERWTPDTIIIPCSNIIFLFLFYYIIYLFDFLFF